MLKENRIKTLLSKGLSIFGTTVQTASPEAVEMVGHAGFDYVMIDMEHGAISPDGSRVADLRVRLDRVADGQIGARHHRRGDSVRLVADPRRRLERPRRGLRGCGDRLVLLLLAGLALRAARIGENVSIRRYARLSAQGSLYTCLFASQGHDLRGLLRAGVDPADPLAGVDQGLIDPGPGDLGHSFVPIASATVRVAEASSAWAASSLSALRNVIATAATGCPDPMIIVVAT